MNSVNSFLSDWFYLSIRQIKLIWRPFLAFLPNFFMPLFFFMINAAAFRSIASLPGFPTGSYLQFIAPTALFTSVFFTTTNLGTELALDISGGYLKKLLIMPISRLVIILSKFSEAAVLALLQGGIILILLMLIGVPVKTGILGVIAMFIMLMIFAMGWSCISMIAALRSGNPRVVQSMWMIVFPMLYLTTAQMPKGFLPHWYETIATYNPVTYVLEGTRAFMIDGWGAPAIWQGFAVAIATFVIMVSFTLLAFRRALK
jgi:ABC-2 type transport system permease protein